VGKLRLIKGASGIHQIRFEMITNLSSFLSIFAPSSLFRPSCCMSYSVSLDIDNLI
jgi:hypothetical protein